MEKLKEYAGVIVAIVTMTTALAALALWTIHVRVEPEIRRLDGRVESLYVEVTGRLDRMDHRFETRFNRIEGEIKTIRGEINTLRGEVHTLGGEVNALRGDVNTIRGDVNTIRDDIKLILLRLPKQNETG